MRITSCTIAALTMTIGACGSDDDDDITSRPANADRVVERTDIVSDQGGAVATDPTLVNAWGLAFNPVGAAWVSAAENGISEVYDANGNHLIPSVTIPGPVAGTPSSPTGSVFNPDASAFQGDTFIFVTEDGTIAGWQQSNGALAVQRVDSTASGAVYKGVTIAKNASGSWRLFAADFHGGKIDVFDAAYAPVTPAGSLQDPEIPGDFAPFNVQEMNGALVVAYAKQDDQKMDDVSGVGNGYVDLFDIDGAMTARLITQGELNSPWGITMAPASFAAAPGRLLIGNFGDGLIHVYSMSTPTVGPARASFEGPLLDGAGNRIVADGLWALRFGVDAGGFRSDQLYFTAGPDDETHGIFGRLQTAQ